jgi:hypothetical protein
MAISFIKQFLKKINLRDSHVANYAPLNDD